MSTKTYCDVCGVETNQIVIKVSVLDGEHPHCGSVMHRSIDCCYSCIHKVGPLHSNREYSNILKEERSLTVFYGSNLK